MARGLISLVQQSIPTIFVRVIKPLAAMQAEYRARILIICSYCLVVPVLFRLHEISVITGPNVPFAPWTLAQWCVIDQRTLGRRYESQDMIYVAIIFKIMRITADECH